ncbi:MAG TPA: hypothetical protein VFF67_00305 [Thermoplasmata archaeon]|nr:hypothetical protein [Thermoplasmata archaeon]
MSAPEAPSPGALSSTRRDLPRTPPPDWRTLYRPWWFGVGITGVILLTLVLGPLAGTDSAAWAARAWGPALGVTVGLLALGVVLAVAPLGAYWAGRRTAAVALR